MNAFDFLPNQKPILLEIRMEITLSYKNLVVL